MEVVLWVEQRGSSDVGKNMRSSLDLIGENAGHVKQGRAKLAVQHRGDACKADGETGGKSMVFAAALKLYPPQKEKIHQNDFLDLRESGQLTDDFSPSRSPITTMLIGNVAWSENL